MLGLDLALDSRGLCGNVAELHRCFVSFDVFDDVFVLGARARKAREITTFGIHDVGSVTEPVTGLSLSEDGIWTQQFQVVGPTRLRKRFDILERALLWEFK